MTNLKTAAALLLLIAVGGFSGCNRHDFGHDRDHVDRDHPYDPRDPRREEHPCDHDHDPHCDDHPR